MCEPQALSTTRSLEMDVTSLRVFLKSSDVFPDGKAMYVKSLTCPETRAFLEYCLSIRENASTRKTYSALRSDMLDTTKAWTGGFLQFAYSMWASMRGYSVPTLRLPEHRALHSLNKEQRALLSGTGLVHARKEPTRAIAAKTHASLMTAITGSPFMLACDNYSILRWTNNPAGDKNKKLDACSYAVLRVHAMPNFRGYPKLNIVFGAIGYMGTALVQYRQEMKASVAELLGQSLTYEGTRTPCDIRRVAVRRSLWRPLQIGMQDTKTTSGMAEVLNEIDVLRHTTGTPVVPILCDIDIYWRFLKMMYGRSYNDLNMARVFLHHPLHFGVWHAYKQCVTDVYERFMPLFVYLEYPAFRSAPATTSVTNFPKLILKERMVMCLFLAGPHVKAHLAQHRAAAHCLEGQSAARLLHAEQMDALWNLMYEYIPCLFLLGKLARDCSWAGGLQNTGGTAHRIIYMALILQIAIGKKAGPYYQRMGVALLMWTPYHTAMPAASNMEEALEAMLSRLAKLMGKDVTVFAGEEVNMLYRSMRLLSGDEMDLRRPNLDKKLVARIQMDIKTLVRDIRLGKLPYIKKASSGGGVTGKSVWPDHVSMPGSLWSPITKAQFEACLTEGVRALMSDSVRDDATTKVLQGILDRNGIGPPGPDTMTDRRDFYREVLGGGGKRKRAVGPKRKKTKDMAVQVGDGLSTPVRLPPVLGIGAGLAPAGAAAPGAAPHRVVLDISSDDAVRQQGDGETGSDRASDSQSETTSICASNASDKPSSKGDACDDDDEWEPEFDPENAEL
jgi:hypothetical protein